MFLKKGSSLLSVHAISADAGHLLLIGSSFTGSFVPFLAPCCERVMIISPECCDKAVGSLVSSCEVSRILFLCDKGAFFGSGGVDKIFTIRWSGREEVFARR